MIVFWILAAGLIGLALLFVLPPFFFRHEPRAEPDQDDLNLDLFRRQLKELDADLASGKLDRRQYDDARLDLERELLYDLDGAPGTPAPSGRAATDSTDAGGSTSEGRWVAALLAVALPSAVVALYLHLGNGAVIQEIAEGPAELPPLEVMVERLEQRLAQDPNNPQGWVMLGRTYFAIAEPAKALDALARAYRVAPGDPDVLVTYAEALAANNDSDLTGRPAELIRAALAIDPRHTSARWLQGLASFQTGHYLEAVEQWEKLAATFDRQSEEADELGRYITEARRRAGQTPEPTPRPTAAAAGPIAQATGEAPNAGAASGEGGGAQPGEAAGSVRVEVTLAEELAAKADKDDSLFVYAKAVSGPPMPLAVHRGRVADLPLTLTLDDSLAMISSMKPSSFDHVMVGARVSKSGQALPRSGDLEGETGPVEPGSPATVKILIDRVRP